MARKIPTTHNLDALTRDELVIAKAGRDAWDAITKTFATWIVLGEAIVMLRNKAHVIGGGRKTFQRLRDQNGFGKIDGGEISRLEKIMANLDAVRGWHAKLPQNKQVEWASPSSVIRHATGPDGKRLFPPVQRGGSKNKTTVIKPSNAAPPNSELDALNERVKELKEEVDLKDERIGQMKEQLGSDFKVWSLEERRKFVTAAGLDFLIQSAAKADQDKVRKGGKAAPLTVEQHFSALHDLLQALPDQDQARDLVNAFVTKLQKADLKNAGKALEAKAEKPKPKAMPKADHLEWRQVNGSNALETHWEAPFAEGRCYRVQPVSLRKGKITQYVVEKDCPPDHHMGWKHTTISKRVRTLEQAQAIAEQDLQAP